MPNNRIPNLAELAALAAAQLENLFHIEVSANRTPEYQDKVARTVESVIKFKLLQAIIDDDRETVKKILDKTPELLEVEPDKALVIESQKTWQRFRAEKPFVMALKRNQLEMVKVLLPYFEKLENGAQVALAQWASAENDLMQQKERTARHSFKSLIDVIAKEFCPNGIKGKLSEATEKALEEFRKTVLPDEAVALSDYYDIEQLLIAVYQAYDDAFNTFQNHKQRNIFSVKVIGFIQSLLTPEDDKVHCEGPPDMVEHNKKIREYVASSKLPDDEEASYAYYRVNHSSYRVNRSAHLGLGFEYVYGVTVELSFKMWCCGVMHLVDGEGLLLGNGCLSVRSALINYAEQKRQNLKVLRGSCHNNTSQLLRRRLTV